MFTADLAPRPHAIFGVGCVERVATLVLDRGARPLVVASRPESASPATGSKAAHDLEQKMLIDEAFAS